MKKCQIKMGAILSYLQTALTILVELGFTPVMLRVLGKSEFGLYNTAASTISMLTILSLGFNSTYVRYFSKYKKNKEVQKVHELNGMYFSVFFLLGLIALICGVYLSFNLELVFDQGLSESEYVLAQRLMILLIINLSISFPMSVFQNIVLANERFIVAKILGIIKTTVGPLISIPVLLLGYRSVAMVVVTIVVSLFADVIYLFYVLKILQEKFVFRNFNFALFKDMLQYSSFIAINIIVDQINANVDNVLLGRFKGTQEVAVYSVGFTFYKCYTKFSTSVSSVFVPRIHALVNSTNEENILKQKLTSLFVKVGRMQFMVLLLICTGVIFFGRPFISFWAGSGYDASYYIAIILMIPATVPLIQNLGIEIQRAQNLHKFRATVYLVMAIVNIIITISLCQVYGAIGSAIGTAISWIIANGIIMNVYYYKKCNIMIGVFWKNILGIMKGLVLPVLFGMLLGFLIEKWTICSFVLMVFLYIIIYVSSMWFIGMNSDEKNILSKPIKTLIKRRGITS